jgi:hypothetical protein
MYFLHKEKKRRAASHETVQLPFFPAGCRSPAKVKTGGPFFIADCRLLIADINKSTVVP